MVHQSVAVDVAVVEEPLAQQELEVEPLLPLVRVQEAVLH
jgi:hypothetical protein